MEKEFTTQNTEREFTEQDLLDTLTEGLWTEYLKYPKIRGYVEFDDLVSECVLGFYEIMKSTGVQRFEYYKSIYDWKHMRNLVRCCAKQCIPSYLKENAFKFQPVSLNTPISRDGDEESADWLDFVTYNDDRDDILCKVSLDDIILRLNREQRLVVRDILAGFGKTVLRDKYPQYDEIVESIKHFISTYYHKAGESIPEEVSIFERKVTQF